jgi:hypothetical protein
MDGATAVIWLGSALGATALAASIDLADIKRTINGMIIQSKSVRIAADVLDDMHAVAEAAAAGRALDPELAKRVRERSEKVQDELRRQYGVREIAVDLIRHGREELKYVLDSNVFQRDECALPSR